MKNAINPETDKTSLKRKEILQAALVEFSQLGLNGARIETIAKKANMSKSNLLYYFDNKEDLYVVVLEDVLTEWLTPLAGLETKAEPKEALKNYIAVKYELSKNNPESSRLYALEIMQGAPHLMNVLKGPLKKLVKQKVQVIETWIEKGKLKAVSPYHLIFHIWAVTQHYADFAVQTDAVVGKTLSNKKFTTEAKQTSFQLLVDSLIP